MGKEEKGGKDVLRRSEGLALMGLWTPQVLRQQM